MSDPIIIDNPPPQAVDASGELILKQFIAEITLAGEDGTEHVFDLCEVIGSVGLVLQHEKSGAVRKIDLSGLVQQACEGMIESAAA